MLWGISPNCLLWMLKKPRQTPNPKSQLFYIVWGCSKTLIPKHQLVCFYALDIEFFSKSMRHSNLNMKPTCMVIILVIIAYGEACIIQ